jgi:hypothetical protein
VLADHPLFKELQASTKTLSEQLAASEKARRLAEVTSRLSSLTATQGGRKYVLPPSVIDAIASGSVEADPVKLTENFVKALEALTTTGYVELGERGRASGIRGTEKDATTMLAERVAAAQTQHFQGTGKQLSYTDAVRAIARQDPELYESYRADSYAGKEE